MRFAFISLMSGCPWGGSEELWSQTAMKLAQQKFAVSASVHQWSPLHPRLEQLRQAGIDFHLRPSGYRLWRRGLHTIFGEGTPLKLREFARFLQSSKPNLLVISTGGALPPIDVVELCVASRIPFVSIGQANDDHVWFPDDVARRYRDALAKAVRCYFVSEANLRLTEKQIGAKFENAEVVRNPFNISYSAAPVWPTPSEDHGLRIACVGRLHPPSKGQDILLEALSREQWNHRAWHLTFCGEGPCKEVLQKQTGRLGLGDKVTFAGYIDDVESIWGANHALVLPSRYEGLPLALVEAMLCGRPAIVTDVAGHKEVVDDGITGFLAESPTVPALGRALDRAWKMRGELQSMGRAAGKRIRELVPPDPAAEFAERIKLIGERAVLNKAPGQNRI
jgi:glycosyltransferase involved in cell wall biosynthesis